MKWGGRQFVYDAAKEDIGGQIEAVLKKQVVESAIAEGHTPIGEPQTNWHQVEPWEMPFGATEHLKPGDWDLRVWVQVEDQ